MAKDVLQDGDRARFRSIEERDEFYRRPLYGERFNISAFMQAQL
jgi:hypothetical protein